MVSGSMPPAAENSSPAVAFVAPAPALRKITDTIARFNARSIDVCCAAGLVALHFQTARGVVHVTLTETEFLQKCRGRLDSNGNPFHQPAMPAGKPIKEKIVTTKAEPVAPLAVAPEEPSAPEPKGPVYPKEFMKRCAAAWAWMNDLKNSWTSCEEVAPRFDVAPMALLAWCTTHHPKEYHGLKGYHEIARKPALKPGGKIL